MQEVWEMNNITSANYQISQTMYFSVRNQSCSIHIAWPWRYPCQPRTCANISPEEKLQETSNTTSDASRTSQTTSVTTTVEFEFRAVVECIANISPQHSPIPTSKCPTQQARRQQSLQAVSSSMYKKPPSSSSPFPFSSS